MAPEIAEVERALLALAPNDRAAVIRSGILSLDDSDVRDEGQSDVDTAWRAELRRRIDEIEHGKVELVSGQESAARIRALLAELNA